MKKSFFIFVFLIVFLSGCEGRKNVTVLEDFKVYLEKEEQVFRDKNGAVIYPIEIDGQVYIPVDTNGGYLGYMPVESEGNLYLYEIENASNKVLEDLNTETYDGEKITSDVFSNAEYTMMIGWGTWCPDCTRLMGELPEYNDYFKENNIQLISFVTDAPYFNYSHIKEDFKPDVWDAFVEKSKDVDFDYCIYIDTVILENLMGERTHIPSYFIFDNNGNLVKTINDDKMPFGEVIKILNGIRGAKNE